MVARGVVSALGLISCLLLVGCDKDLTIKFPGLPAIRATAACDRLACGALGEVFGKMLDGANSPVVLSSVSEYLGASVDPTRLLRAPTPCGNAATPAEWGGKEPPAVLVDVNLEESSRDQLKTELSARLTGAVPALAGTASAKVNAAVARAVDGSAKAVIRIRVRTYTLTSSAFFARKQSCGNTKVKRVVRSAVMASVEGTAFNDVQSRIATTLAADADLKSLFGAAHVDLDQVSEKVTREVVNTSAQPADYLIAIGYDKP